MLIRDYMTPNPTTVDEDASVMSAVELMKERKVRRFPVVRDSKLVGMVTDRDLRSAAPSQVVSFDARERELMPELYSLLSNIRIKEIMARQVITVRPEQTIVTAAVLMLRHRISGLPVVDSQGKLSGIITETDIFKVLVDLSGIHSGKTVFAFRLEDRPGSIKEVADVIREQGAGLASILTSYALAEPGSRRAFIRIRDLPPEKLQALESVLRKKFEVLYAIQDDTPAS